MLSNAYLLAKIGADTAENEQRFAEILSTGTSGLQEVAYERLFVWVQQKCAAKLP